MEGDLNSLLFCACCCVQQIHEKVCGHELKAHVFFVSDTHKATAQVFIRVMLMYVIFSVGDTSAYICNEQFEVTQSPEQRVTYFSHLQCCHYSQRTGSQTHEKPLVDNKKKYTLLLADLSMKSEMTCLVMMTFSDEARKCVKPKDLPVEQQVRSGAVEITQ